MPELPEVEVVRMGLEKSLVGQKFVDITVRNSKIVTSNSNKRIGSKIKEDEFIHGSLNKIIIKVERRAKNIIITLEDDSIILIHLKMTGQLIHVLNSPSLWERWLGGEASHYSKHTHIIFTLTNNNLLLYNDVRKFGYVLYYKNMDEAKKLFEKYNLGLEPFDVNFTLDFLRDNLITKNKCIKQVLLEQSVVVGCGNIYADEICFASGVLPARICSTLKKFEVQKLHDNIIIILSEAIKSGGSSISDYKNINGENGKYASKHKVYGRAGQPCALCKDTLQKILISGRSTVFCNTCQK